MFICLLINLFVSCPISESTLKLPILMLVPTDGLTDGRTLGRTDGIKYKNRKKIVMIRDLQFGTQFKFRLMLRFVLIVLSSDPGEFYICKAD